MSAMTLEIVPRFQSLDWFNICTIPNPNKDMVIWAASEILAGDLLFVF